MLDHLREGLKVREGFRARPYVDTQGKLTIGYGRNLDDNPLTKDEAAYLLENDMRSAISRVHALFPWAIQTLNTARFGVLVEMVFQLGSAGVQGFRKFLAYAEDGQYDKAAEEMLDSRWASQTPERAQYLARVFRLGKDV